MKSSTWPGSSKTFTLKAIEGDQRYGDPVLVRIDETLLRPFALCRALASRFELSIHGTFDTVFSRVVKRLTGTQRMIMFDEVERVAYRTLELIRDLHDLTGCPVLLCGKPTVYAKLGFRSVGDFSEVTDQLAARIVVRRDLTERTRGDNPEPLFTLKDIRNLVRGSQLKLHVTPDAEKWLQSRASTLGMGGIGKALVCFYLASKLAFVKGDATITAEHLEDVDHLSMGHEDAEEVAKLATHPGSSTPKQRCRLHQLKRRHGWTADQLHHAIGSPSTTSLSAAEASECIKRLGGGKLPHPPGKKPAPFAKKPRRTDATRMIAPDHVEQIDRMLREHFGDMEAGHAWLKKDFDAETPRDLLTARRAGQVIHVLKEMIER